MAAPERRAAIRLAVLMGRTVGELGDSMTALEFAEVLNVMPELAAQHPAMQGAGIVAAMLANVNRAKDGPSYGPRDFLPDPFAAEPEEPDVAAFVAGIGHRRHG